MEVRFAMTVVGFLTTLTLLAGVLQGLVVGGVLAQDALVLSTCGWIQGVVGGGLLCGTHLILTFLQGSIWVGLLLRQSWARYLGILLGLVYTCSGLFPFGLLLIVLLIRARDAFSDATLAASDGQE